MMYAALMFCVAGLFAHALWLSLQVIGYERARAERLAEDTRRLTEALLKANGQTVELSKEATITIPLTPKKTRSYFGSRSNAT